MLMQQSLRKFAENKPEKASKLGITSSPSSNSDSDVEYKPEKKPARLKKEENKKNAIEMVEEPILDTFTALAGNRKRKTTKEPEKPAELLRTYKC